MNPSTIAQGLALWLACGPAPALAQTGAPASPAGPLPTVPGHTSDARLWPLEVRINGVTSGTWVLLETDGQLKVTFPVRSGRAALVRVVLEDGQPVPAGATLKLPGDAQVFHVARRGEVFVTGLGTGATAQLRWNGASCNLHIALPTDAILPISRPRTSKGVQR